MMFMNRWLTRHEIVEQNNLTQTEEEQVFAQLQPRRGGGSIAQFLEVEADEVIGQVRVGRPQSPMPSAIDKEEDGRMSNDGMAIDVGERFWSDLERLFEFLFPKGTEELVGTEYLAKKLGYCRQWICKMADTGVIPESCIAPRGSGGRSRRFYRIRIDAWIAVER